MGDLIIEMSAEEEKAKGNAAMGQKNFEEAIKHYSAAIELAPDNHVLYSNRSAAYLNIGKYEEALQDGEKAIGINPGWGKGYSRNGHAAFKMNRLEEAIEAYEKAIELEPDNASYKQTLKDIQAQASSAGFNMFAQMFKSPGFYTMLQTDPELKAYLQQPDFVQMINSIQQNPQTLNLYMQDKRLMTVITKLLQAQMGGAGAAPQGSSAPEQAQETPATPAEPEKKSQAPAEPEKKPEEEEMDENVKQALEEKEKGNQAYKNKKFDEAIQHYEKAIELNPNEMTFLTNKAAAYMESGKFDECIAACEKAVEVGRSHYAPYEQIAKAYSRIGAAYRKQGNLEKAIAAYNTSLTENRNRATQKILRDLEREKEKRDKEAYMDPKLALEAKEKGNEAFQSGDFPKAIALYTEAIERDPTNAPFYSNRAAAYMKVADFGYAYKDCEKCIELDPTFVKAYKRKALIHNYNKDFHKAIDCYNKCLELNPEDGDAKTGLQNSRMLLAKAQSDPEQREIRRQRAMADPEIQQILQNPMVERLLQNLLPGGDQAAAMKMMNQDPSLREAFEKLLNSGAIHMGP